MIESILPNITSGEEYLTALSLFRHEAPKKAGAETLIGLYRKYGLDKENPELAPLYLAIDMMQDRTLDDKGDFAALEIPEADLDALFHLRAIAKSGDTPDAEMISHALETVTGGAVSRPVAILLARGTLNAISWRRDLSDVRDQVTALAGFLGSINPEELSKYAILAQDASKNLR